MQQRRTWRGGRGAGRGAPEAQRGARGGRPDRLWIYGVHAVAAALGNPRRRVLRLVATRNALARLAEQGAPVPGAVEDAEPRELDRLVGADAVHQGVAAEVEPLPPLDLADLGDARLLVVLDQVTDPHNVGAILRSAAAIGADAVVTTGRHAPHEGGVLAKAASGALDLVPLVEVANLARALGQLGTLGFTRVGLDSDGTLPIEEALASDRIALVLGAEGKGLRRLTRDTCDVVARLVMGGPLRSLNVSNAAVLALYLARRSLDAAPPAGNGT